MILIFETFLIKIYLPYLLKPTWPIGFLCFILTFSSIIGSENKTTSGLFYKARKKFFFPTMSLLTTQGFFSFLAVVRTRLMKLVLSLFKDVDH